MPMMKPSMTFLGLLALGRLVAVSTAFTSVAVSNGPFALESSLLSKSRWINHHFTLNNPLLLSPKCAYLRDPSLLMFFGQQEGGKGIDPDASEKSGMDEIEQDISAKAQEATETGRRVEELERQVERYEQEIAEKERLLEQGGDGWALEKVDLVAKISEFANKLQQKETEMEETAGSLEEAAKREAELRSEIEKLQEALRTTKESLETEKKSAAEALERLMDVEDKLEFEQNQFSKEKNELKERIDEGFNKINQVSSEFKKEQERFEQERSDLRKQIQSDASVIAAKEEQLKNEETKFKQEQSELEALLQDEKDKLLDMENKMKVETSRFSEERRELKKLIEEERLKVVDLKKEMDDKQELFDITKADLESKIEFEQSQVVEMQDFASKEQERFLEEKAEVEAQLALEQSRLFEAEKNLEEETDRFEKEARRLKDMISDGDRIRQLKARQMNVRYTKIREELLGLVEAARRDTRKERRRLIKKYDGRFNELGAKTNNLIMQYKQSQEEVMSLKGKLEDITQTNDRLQQQMGDMETNYKRIVAARDRDIVGLKNALTYYQNEVRDRDDKIEKYETSFKEIARLSWRLTRKRVYSSPSRVVDFLRRRRRNKEQPK